MLADDSVTAQNMGRKILSDAGYEVITVNNGSAALKKISESKPDLIVLDVYMPGYSGLEVCQRLKETHETARLPILLTVGKLEPFKPEEARRVRAEGFIVKPFEASELLSALSKLEDKIVPRGESSKTGRFGRAIAAADDADRYGNDGDPDSGWKNRIAFPSRKKSKTEDPEENDPSIYNSVNRDLRTVVDHAPLPQKDQDDAANRVDVGALGAPGVPRDVSPEEIAAITAAAAQVHASAAAVQASESEPETTATGSSSSEFEVAAPNELAADPGIEAPSSQIPEPEASVSFAAPGERAVEPVSAEAVADLPTNGNSLTADASSFAPPTFDRDPVTMAASPAAADPVENSWIAVPVPLDADDNAASLEVEMQKAYAAFAAAEANAPGFVSYVVTPSQEFVEPACDGTPADVSAPVPEPIASSEGTATPVGIPIPEPGSNTVVDSQMTQSINLVAGVATDAMTGAIAESAQFGSPSEAELQSPVEPPQSDTELQPSAELSSEGRDAGNFRATEFASSEPPQRSYQLPEPIPADPVHAAEPPVTEIASTESLVSESPAVSAESVAETQPGIGDKAESDLAATTAAAWANWRQGRDDSQTKVDSASFSDSNDSTPGLAAMAAAAGAEKAPEVSSQQDTDDPAAIASIVDSVLADLRPKIVEEISRKLGKKK